MKLRMDPAALRFGNRAAAIISVNLMTTTLTHHINQTHLQYIHIYVVTYLTIILLQLLSNVILLL